MNEQQRREQIMKARQQQMQQRATAPAMSDADAVRIAAENGAITQEQVVMAAMLGKMINGGLNDLKKQSVGEGLKVGSVDMSKVMPSGIAKAMGATMQPPPQRMAAPIQTEPVIELPQVPALFPPTAITPLIPPINPVLQSASDPNQLELDFEKRVRYEDIEGKLQILENKLIALNEKADNILELLRKKKLNEQEDGTQTG